MFKNCSNLRNIQSMTVLQAELIQDMKATNTLDLQESVFLWPRTTQPEGRDPLEDPSTLPTEDVKWFNRREKADASRPCIFYFQFTTRTRIQIHKNHQHQGASINMMDTKINFAFWIGNCGGRPTDRKFCTIRCVSMMLSLRTKSSSWPSCQSSLLTLLTW